MSQEVETKPLSFNIMEIMEVIPHRYPFLLIDRITECVPGKSVKGYKNISMNEQLFEGHFPENPIFPGVLQIEAMAQTSIFIVLTTPEYKGKLALFAGINNVRFKKVVRPGDKLEFHCEVIKLRGPICKTKCIATVDGEVACEAELMCAIQ